MILVIWFRVLSFIAFIIIILKRSSALVILWFFSHQGCFRHRCDLRNITFDFLTYWQHNLTGFLNDNLSVWIVVGVLLDHLSSFSLLLVHADLVWFGVNFVINLVLLEDIEWSVLLLLFTHSIKVSVGFQHTLDAFLAMISPWTNHLSLCSIRAILATPFRWNGTHLFIII
jgi:hypothetical protein